MDTNPGGLSDLPGGDGMFIERMPPFEPTTLFGAATSNY
jgi:hypothetical protein